MFATSAGAPTHGRTTENEETARWYGRERTSPLENNVFLRGPKAEIRFEVDGPRILLVHGSPRRTNEYLLEDGPISSFQRLAASSNADMIAFGHTHKPHVKTVDGVLFVNVGPVGKPKDVNPHACYAILDTAGPSAEFVRMPHDVRRVAAPIRASTLPHEFATTLETGGAAGLWVGASDRRAPDSARCPLLEAHKGAGLALTERVEQVTFRTRGV